MGRVVGLFGSRDEAQCAIEGLRDIGIGREDMSLVMRDRREGGDVDAGDATTDRGGLLGGLARAVENLFGGDDAETGGRGRALVDADMPEEEAQYYQTSVERGGILLTVQAPEGRENEAREIMRRCGMRDVTSERQVRERDPEYRYDVARRADMGDREVVETSQRADVGTTARTGTTETEGETVIPVIEEELEVGTRQVERGGVRVETRVKEQPAEEQVRLRDEEVHVERRPVDRPADQADIDAALRQGTIEVTETDEEAVAAKEARVVEEVVISKDVQERTEMVRDTVRRTHVDVVETGGEGTPSTSEVEVTARGQAVEDQGTTRTSDSETRRRGQS